MAGVQIHGNKLLKFRHKGENKNLLVLRGNRSTNLFDVHPLVEEFNSEHGTRLKVVSHDVADTACTVGETWESLPAFVVDALVAYEKPHTSLGKEIVLSVDGEPRVVLATGKCQGEKDVALVTLRLTPADFQKDGNSLTLDIPDSRLIIVSNFPGSSGWYMPHAKTGVPHGGEVCQSPDARYLHRLKISSYAGFLVRGGSFSGRQYVIAYFRASDRLAVVAEVPEIDVAKVELLISP